MFASYFNLLAQSMSSMFVRGISEVAEVLVAIKRLQTFLLSEEFEDKQQIENNNINNEKSSNLSLKLKNFTAKWNENSTENTLSDLNLDVQKGKLIAIIGPVGAGKSSLLQAILGELPSTDGNVNINGKLSYASQEPWVFAASVRQNILFGMEYDKYRYSNVIKACALEKDFQQFPYGDQTIVGDRGASLSGGQKARINLARAVYRKADIFLLDDPLSAVDTHVAKHLYEECIMRYLENKTRILVTHQIQHLQNADHIIIMTNVSTSNLHINQFILMNAIAYVYLLIAFFHRQFIAENILNCFLIENSVIGYIATRVFLIIEESKKKMS